MLTVIHANHLEDLRSHVVREITEHPLDPLVNDVILVQSNGIAQWLKLALAEQGVSMGLEITLPARFQWQLYRTMPRGDAIPHDSPFDKERLVWWIMKTLPALEDVPEFGPLKRFLTADADPLRRRYQLAMRIADLFDQYQVYRADWLTSWLTDWASREHRSGEDSAALATGHAHEAWQGQLWHRLIGNMPSEFRGTDRGTVHEQFLEHLAGAQMPSGIPPRVTVFGISTLSMQMVQVLHGISRFAHVIFCVQNPSRGTGDEGSQNSLYAAWGLQSREYISFLDSLSGPDQNGENRKTIALFRSPGRDTILHRIQDDILESTTPRRGSEPRENGDNSLVFHAAHSALREVEILHDQLLDAFDRDPDLRPRHVMVMVPDISRYASLVTAVFGSIPPTDPRYIPFVISDQASTGPDPIMGALEILLSLPDSRATLEEITALLDTPALCNRFGIDHDGRERIVERVRHAGIRWGLDGTERSRFGFPAGIDQNTWHFGLKRILLGYATGSSGVWNGISAMEDLTGSDSEALGQMAELVESLRSFSTTLKQPRSPTQWILLFEQMLARFFDAETAEENVRLEELRGALAAWEEAARQADYDEEIPVTVARDAWLENVNMPGLAQRFFAGAVNFATLMPMRAIPFTMVCLLGMNDGDYPRQQTSTGFDLMQFRELRRPGDRSRREDDRHLFLEALLSARKRLYISWVGRSISDNSRRPPSVLVGQLRDYPGIDADQITTYHPLQPFSREYFSGSGKLFTYAREWRESAPAPPESAPAGEVGPSPDPRHGSHPGPVPSPGAAPDIPVREIRLRHINTLLANPDRVYLEERLRVRLDAIESDDIPRDEPFQLDSLEQWSLKNELIHEAIAAPDRSPEELLHRHALAGRLQVPPFDSLVADEILHDVENALHSYREEAKPIQDTRAMSRLVTVPGTSGTAALVDEITDIHEGTDGILRRLFVTPTRIHDGHGSYRWNKLVRWWPSHLAAQDPGRPVFTIVVTIHGPVTFPPLPRERARELLASLVDLRLEAESLPFMVTCGSGCAWVAAGGSAARDEALKQGRKSYLGSGNQIGDYHRSAPLQRVWQDPEPLVGSEPFVRQAELLYGPMVDHFRGESRGTGGAP